MQTTEIDIDSRDTKDLPSLPNTLKYSRKNIPIENIIELKKKNLSNEQVAKLLGCSKTNITQRLQECKEDLEGLDRWKTNRADILAWKQKKVLEHMTEAKLKSAPLNVLGPAFGILYDKERLERGQSTENISVKSIVNSLNNDREDLNRRKEALLNQLSDGDT